MWQQRHVCMQGLRKLFLLRMLGQAGSSNHCCSNASNLHFRSPNSRTGFNHRSTCTHHTTRHTSTPPITPILYQALFAVNSQAKITRTHAYKQIQTHHIDMHSRTDAPTVEHLSEESKNSSSEIDAQTFLNASQSSGGKLHVSGQPKKSRSAVYFAATRARNPASGGYTLLETRDRCIKKYSL